MRIYCPVCKAAFWVPEEAAAGARRMRCGNCGRLFDPKEPDARDEPAMTNDTAVRSRPREAVPPPPAVIYVTSGNGPIPGPEPAMAVFPEPNEPPAAKPEHPHPPDRDPDDPGPLGPPPPYLPAKPLRRPDLPRVEMAPAPPAAPLNIRTLGVLGAPPPYRPIIVVGKGFGRGPAPDLEPWRVASLAQAARGQEPASFASDIAAARAQWTIAREPEPEIKPNYDADQKGRKERDNRPSAAWPASRPPLAVAPRARRALRVEQPGSPRFEPPVAVGLPRLPRGRRSALWLYVVMVLIFAAGIGLFAGRETVMWYVPSTIALYGAVGLEGGVSPPAFRERPEPPATDEDCGNGQPDRPQVACENGKPATMAK